MAFQLNIRHNIESAGDAFARGAVRSFSQGRVTVGSSPDCTCALDTPELLAEHFRIEFEPSLGPARLHAQAGAQVYVNDDLLDGVRDLLSGDEIRVGHWTFLFQKVYPPAGRAAHTSILATLAKLLLAAILVSEVIIVVWLPRRLRHMALWQNEVARQRSAVLLDTLRRRNRDAAPVGELEQAARQVIQDDLDERAHYLRRHEEAMTADQRRAMYEDLLRLGTHLDRLDAGDMLRPVPDIDVDAGVRAILKDRGDNAIHE